MTTATYTTAEVANALGVTPRRVRALATQHRLGTLMTPRLRLFTTREVEVLRARETRPGNRTGRPRKRKDSAGD